MTPSDDHVLDQTQSLCPSCLKRLPASIRSNAQDEVWMEWVCPDHGPWKALVSPCVDTYLNIRRIPRKIRKPAFFREPVSAGCPDDCGLCSSHEQHTCLAILEVTARCDAGCPICLADSKEDGRDLSVATVAAALSNLIRMEGAPVPLQISGGEPTLHGDLPSIVRAATSLGFRKIEVDTNGRTLAKHPDLCFRLKESGLSGIYLQMDVNSAPVSRKIRGRDDTALKRKAIENCKRAGLQIVLSVTVVQGVNSERMWEMVRFGIENNLTGVNFQPAVRSGRYPQALLSDPSERITLGRFQKEIEAQSKGILRATDMMPIPCPSPFCGAMAYLLVSDDTIIPLNRVLAGDRLSNHLANLSDWEDVLAGLHGSCSCGPQCNPDPDPSALAGGGHEFFSIGFHGMMDAFCFDIQRAKRCCVHELLPDGRLIPFCLYNVKYRNASKAYSPELRFCKPFQ